MGCTALWALGALLAAPPTETRLVDFPQYRAGGFHRSLFGSGYRDLWTTPIAVPVLDLGAFGGGLTPLEKTGRHQSLSLVLQGADGRRYKFRSTDKDTNNALPQDLQHSHIA